MKRILLLSLTLFCLTTSWAQTAPVKKKVGVYVTGEGTEASVKDLLSAMLISTIIQQKGYLGVERTEQFLAQMQKEKNTQRPNEDEAKKFSRLGKQFGVGFVCVASISKLGSQFVIFVSLIDVEKASVVATANGVDPYTDTSLSLNRTRTLGKMLFMNDNASAAPQAPPNNNRVETDFVFVKGAEFLMGCTDEQKIDDKCTGVDEIAIHYVNVSSFKISKTEVTVAQFAKFVNATGYTVAGDWKFWCSSQDPNQCNMPVVNVTWDDAVAYCKWVGGRLPTEAEWEYAARGGDVSMVYTYAGSDDLSAVGWYKYTASAAKKVALNSPNELGIYDMSGNVLEWCSDWYSKSYYLQNTGSNPKGVCSGDDRCAR